MRSTTSLLQKLAQGIIKKEIIPTKGEWMDKDCYGMHLTLRITNVENSALLNEKNVIHEFLIKLVTDIKMRILAGPLVGEECSLEGKSGCSGLILLYESHAAIHTYVDLKEAFIDIFSCREFDVESVQGTIHEFFGSHEIAEQKIFDRGFHWRPNLEQTLKEWSQTRISEPGEVSTST